MPPRPRAPWRPTHLDHVRGVGHQDADAPRQQPRPHAGPDGGGARTVPRQRIPDLPQRPTNAGQQHPGVGFPEGQWEGLSCSCSCGVRQRLEYACCIPIVLHVPPMQQLCVCTPSKNLTPPPAGRTNAGLQLEAGFNQPAAMATATILGQPASTWHTTPLPAHTAPAGWSRTVAAAAGLASGPGTGPPPPPTWQCG
jgi:hypothetical protein